ncbi:hypothetical protein [Kingella oralis]|nr:hypothetical protein [Kingella oralis]QMT43810.1 hypothetical protein H3L93_05690 [Kingella oralis]
MTAKQMRAAATSQRQPENGWARFRLPFCLCYGAIRRACTANLAERANPPYHSLLPSSKGIIMKTSLALIFCALSLSLSAGTATAKTRHAKASPKARHAAQASGNALPLKANGCAHFTAGKGSYRFSVPDEGKALHSSASGVLTAPDGETLYMARGIDTDSGAAFYFADLPEAGSYAVRFDRGGKVSVCIE